MGRTHHTINTLHPLLSSSLFAFLPRLTMSTCGNCDCVDKSQCVKKGNSYGIDIVETEKSYVDEVIVAAEAAEHDGKCKSAPPAPAPTASVATEKHLSLPLNKSLQCIKNKKTKKRKKKVWLCTLIIRA